MRSPFSCSSRALIALALAVAACSDSTAPSPENQPDGGATFDGVFQPGGASFLLQRIDQPVPGRQPVPIELIGSNVKLDEVEQTISVDVALRNASSQALYAPAIVWLSGFVPAEVFPLNADAARDDTVEPQPAEPHGVYGFDYSDLLGDDGALGPGERSDAKTWIFRDPGLGSFSFAAAAEFGMEPDRPVIAGMIFSDLNRNGLRDEGEGPYLAGGVTVRYPDGTFVYAGPDQRGFYRVPVTQPGLHRVTFVSLLACPACTDAEACPPCYSTAACPACACLTTPNPLEVLLASGPDGRPLGFEQADFGVFPGPCPPPPTPLPAVVLSDLAPDEIAKDPYRLLGAELQGNVFSVRVGYSGCGPEHPFILYAGRAFMESSPVQTWMLLAHDGLGQLCDAYFEETLYFDLGPIQEAYIAGYGEPGVVRILFQDFDGNTKEFLLEPSSVTGTGS